MDTSEKLVARRQTVNTFFLSVNALLLSIVGIVLRETIKTPMAFIGVIAIGASGILLCLAWRRLINSFGQLNTAKFAIIYLLEECLPAAPFKAEWEVLRERKDKKKYIPFTKTESTTPIIFIVLYGIAILGTSFYLLNLRFAWIKDLISTASGISTI